MHELSIIQSVVDIILNEMPKHGLTSISRIVLRVGAMRQVVPDSLQFAFECVQQGTPLENALLEIEHVPVNGRCATCHHDVAMQHWLDVCPLCKSGNLEIVSGKELQIKELEGD
ncbi:hydrogenase maturation nickel metallochaperone HypA [candidate division KSB1 bacterium]|nr:hydrogenase maturation nickel metallochaperone HypA [candidate division KSB1 bacterium]